MTGPPHLTLRATLADYLELVVSRKTHRAYFVDGAVRPVAVATLTDLLHAIAGERPPHRPQA
jgi:CBS domain-containing protein